MTFRLAIFRHTFLVHRTSFMNAPACYSCVGDLHFMFSTRVSKQMKTQTNYNESEKNAKKNNKNVWLIFVYGFVTLFSHSHSLSL